MSYVKIMVHAVWSTKRREAILTSDKRSELFYHIKEHALIKNIHVDTIGGYIEHVHCLISLSADQSIAKVIKQLKGESSHWANKQKLFSSRLEWADEYFAASVNIKTVDVVRSYIKNQEEHHKKMTFQKEYEKFIDQHGF